MQEDPTPVEEDVESTSPAEMVRFEFARLKAEARAWTEVANKLSPLTKDAAFEDLGKYRKRLEKLRAELTPSSIAEFGLAPLMEALDDHAGNAAARLRQRLSRELKGACESGGLGFRVIQSEDPIEIRIPPLSVEVDLKSGVASIRFARQEVHHCAADPDQIVKGHASAMRALETAFDGRKYLQACWRAYRTALAETGGKPGERVELLLFLPHLALQLQSKRFRTDPVEGNFRGYSRAHFAYDVLRLRRARALELDGRRIEFGVATGTSATDKKRVVYLENEEGRGQYTLTVYFREIGSGGSDR